MKYIEKDLGNKEYAYIVPIADLHIGDPNFNESKFIDLRTWIQKEENAFIILIDDLLNCATKNSVSDVYGEIMTPQQAKKKAVELLEPIKNKILAITSGNHEDRIYKESGTDISEDIADRLGIDYDMNGLLLDVKIGNNGPGQFNYTIYCTHGTGAGRSIGGKANTLKRASEIIESDIYCIGHIHFMQSYSDYIYIPDTVHHKLIKQKRLYMSCGSFLDYGGYSERKMFAPGKTGTGRIRIDGKRKDFHCSI